jgi:hypothetical protein
MPLFSLGPQRDGKLPYPRIQRRTHRFTSEISTSLAANLSTNLAVTLVGLDLSFPDKVEFVHAQIYFSYTKAGLPLDSKYEDRIHIWVRKTPASPFRKLVGQQPIHRERVLSTDVDPSVRHDRSCKFNCGACHARPGTRAAV